MKRNIIVGSLIAIAVAVAVFPNHQSPKVVVAKTNPVVAVATPEKNHQAPTIKKAAGITLTVSIKPQFGE